MPTYQPMNTFARPSKTSSNFPVDEEKPKWVWIPASLCNEESEEEIKAYLSMNQGDELKLNKSLKVVVDSVARKRFKHRVDVLMNHAFNFDGSPINKSVVYFTSGRIGFSFSAPIVAYAVRDSWHREDMDMEDATALCHFMISYANERPEFMAGSKRMGRKVEGVKIRCDGEIKRSGGERFVAVKVPPSAPVFWLGKSGVHDSEIAEAVGLPLISARYSFLPVEAGKIQTGYATNIPATLMHKNISSKAPPAELIWDIPDDFGVAAACWQSGVGGVLVVRQNRQPLKPHVVEALCSFIANELGPLFQCLWSDELYEGTSVTREQLLAQITPRKWEMYLQAWKDEKSIPDEESEDEDSDSDSEVDRFSRCIL
ncbi:hypothetical protein LTR36_007372 [Oleoguttula mirabilis]|uniref:Uncharacterized protein n=1 Tax=Oleoguttula mirabilis TaxID=1507867 RepID=A0AAV9J9P4_9PEZI|nr:hypothetical protein LTR36_007372 [Oleoguttula mirabilis]